MYQIRVSVSFRTAVIDGPVVETIADQTVPGEMRLGLLPRNPLGIRRGFPQSNGIVPLG